MPLPRACRPERQRGKLGSGHSAIHGHPPDGLSALANARAVLCQTAAASDTWRPSAWNATGVTEELSFDFIELKCKCK